MEYNTPQKNDTYPTYIEATPFDGDTAITLHASELGSVAAGLEQARVVTSASPERFVESPHKIVAQMGKRVVRLRSQYTLAA
jgi:hypothetical protein